VTYDSWSQIEGLYCVPETNRSDWQLFFPSREAIIFYQYKYQQRPTHNRFTGLTVLTLCANYFFKNRFPSGSLREKRLLNDESVYVHPDESGCLLNSVLRQHLAFPEGMATCAYGMPSKVNEILKSHI